MPWLINAAQLDKFRKNQKNIIILDASFHHSDRNAHKEFLEKHIADAQFFPIDMFSSLDTSAPHSHMLLRDEKSLSEKLSKLGIRNDYKIIFYDNSELHTACRALWMLKIFGHNPQLLYILDGGLSAWLEYGGKIGTGETSFSPKPYQVNFQTNLIRDLSQMKNNLQNPTEQIIDTRHPVRFVGGPETRPGLRLGHIPGSYSFPFMVLFDKDGSFLPLEKIRKRLTSTGMDFNSPIVTSCGSGMTAPTLNFILDLLGHNNHAVYNGSWAEWGAEKLYPDEKNLDERPVETCVD